MNAVDTAQDDGYGDGPKTTHCSEGCVITETVSRIRQLLSLQDDADSTTGDTSVVPFKDAFTAHTPSRFNILSSILSASQEHRGQLVHLLDQFLAAFATMYPVAGSVALAFSQEHTRHLHSSTQGDTTMLDLAYLPTLLYFALMYDQPYTLELVAKRTTHAALTINGETRTLLL